MIVIGLTGNYGMGKSTAAQMFKELGAVVIDTDEIVRELLNDPAVIHEIKNIFGQDIVDNGVINKKMLADIVFDNPSLRISLEDILHPRVFRNIEKDIAKITDTSAIVIVEAPVIFERGYQNRFDKIITVYTSEEIAIQRLKEKGISEADTRRRLKSQFSVQMKISKSDFSIDNSQDLNYTKNQIEDIYNRLMLESSMLSHGNN